MFLDHADILGGAKGVILEAGGKLVGRAGLAATHLLVAFLEGVLWVAVGHGFALPNHYFSALPLHRAPLASIVTCLQCQLAGQVLIAAEAPKAAREREARERLGPLKSRKPVAKR